MIVSHLNSGRKAEFTVDGTVLSIGSLLIDLAERQTDVQRIIDVCLDTTYTTVREGVGAWYVATIIIPPREYQFTKNSETTIVPMPLDMNKVEIRLWALPEGVEL